MKQVIQSARTGKLVLKDVPAPKVKAGHLLVQTRASLISAGTDRLMTEFARKSLLGKAQARPDLVKKVFDKLRRDGISETWTSVMARLDEPLPLGYSAAGSVIAVGAGLEGTFRVGERVAIAGAGLANHAELNVVPKNLAVPIPQTVSDEEACFATLSAIAMHAVRNVGATLGDRVAVIGLGLVGQLACQLLTLSGIRVVALDVDVARIDLARQLGVERISEIDDAAINRILAWSGDKGVDAVLIAAATDSNEPFATAAAIARDRARVVLVGKTGTEFSYRDFMQKELSVIVSRSYGPGRYDDDFESRGMTYPEGYVRWTETANLAECARLMSPTRQPRLNIAPLISHRFSLEQAEDAYALVTGHEPHLGVVLTYKDALVKTPHQSFAEPKVQITDGKCVLGVIGAGNFARTQLLPALKGMKNIILHTLVSERGASAEHSQETFGFSQASTNADDVFSNKDINAVLIATRHDHHANLTIKALQAGKSVLVEKPLALNREDINAIAAARNESQGFFQVGFNRRFAPMSINMREFLGKHAGPKFVLLRINTGALPADHWIHDTEQGGGRILGEACHFVDLARYLISAAIESVQASAPRTGTVPCEDATITLRFTDGSLATIAYTAQGDSVYSKERIEAYAGGAVMVIDDFRECTIAENGQIKSKKAASGKGIALGLQAFIDAILNGGPVPIDEAEIIEYLIRQRARLTGVISKEQDVRKRAAQIIEANKTETQKLNEEIREFISLRQQGFLTEEQTQTAITRTKEKIDDLSESNKELKRVLGDVSNSVQGAFEDFVLGADSAGDAVRKLGLELARVALRETTSSLFGGIIKSAASSLFGGFFADGGRPPVGKFSIVGENGPEVFAPDTAGTIIPNDQLGGGGGPTIFADMRGASVEAVQRLERFVIELNGSIEPRAVAAVSGENQRDPTLLGATG